jgi:hypothetical protein
MVKPWPKSKAGCKRQIDAILNSYRRDFAGGGSFGFDWATMRSNSPARYGRIRELQKLWHDLPANMEARFHRHNHLTN